MKVWWLCALLVMNSALAATPAQASLQLMPYPLQVTLKNGELRLGAVVSWSLTGDDVSAWQASLQDFSHALQRQGAQATRWRSDVVGQLQIHIAQSGAMSPRVNDWDESYQLDINGQAITLIARQRVGALRGLATLLQLARVEPAAVSFPQLSIADAPRFRWRGVLLDSARHFFSVDTIKRQLDAMAAAKYNLLHWHLTDDQGWRLESLRYPRLHQQGSDGLYYSRDQVRDIVAYAAARGIQVLPEIDLPGHATAIGVAYPELMSAPGPYQLERRWGVHKPTLNPANAQVYEFVDALVAEITELFPFEYLHIGGDEVEPDHWLANADIVAYMDQHGLADAQALQAHFNQRMHATLAAHDRRMMGWDEVQHPALARDLVIQSWRGWDGVSEAVTAGFPAVLSTGFYLDQPQSASYHYRNDPLPPAPVPALNAAQLAQAKAWSFSLPRKRGAPVNGQFILGHDDGVAWAMVDFAGKSRRIAQVQFSDGKQARFSLDSWMGPVSFQVRFDAEQVSGQALVGNAPYPLEGQRLAQVPRSSAVQAPVLNAAAQALILGGEAALWSELVDENTIDLRLWPRAFAVAERLWSDPQWRDETSLYRRLFALNHWSQHALGLQQTQRYEQALRRLAGSDAAQVALARLAEQLQPAYYYHRHHEKSVHASYSLADPLDQLADALPVESERLWQFEQQLWRWWHQPVNGPLYRSLQVQLVQWQRDAAEWDALLKTRPELAGLMRSARSVAGQISLLLHRRATTSALSADEQRLARQVVSTAQQVDREMVVATGALLDRLLLAQVR